MYLKKPAETLTSLILKDLFQKDREDDIHRLHLQWVMASSIRVTNFK